MELLGQLKGVDIYYNSKAVKDHYTIDSVFDTHCLAIPCTDCPFADNERFCNLKDSVLEEENQLFKNHPELLI